MTPEQILPLLSNPEELRISAAEADGWTGCTNLNCEARKAQHLHKGAFIGYPESYSTARYPNYPTDANALHAAEQRLGLHLHTNNRLQLAWILNLEELIKTLPTCSLRCGKPSPSTIDYLLVPTPIRCAAFIFTAQWLKEQEGGAA